MYPGSQVTNKQLLYNSLAPQEINEIRECSSVKDVQNVVKKAHEWKLPISVLGGGHGFLGNALSKQGITIRTKSLNQIDLDIKNLRLTVQSGTTSEEIFQTLKPHNLMIPLGTGGTTSIAGYTLPGGLSNSSTIYGAAIDSLVELEMVDAEGNALRVNEHEHPDLFWACRGAGEHFGIITSLTFQLQKLPSHIYAGFLFYPFQDSKHRFNKILSSIINDDYPHGLSFGGLMMDCSIIEDDFMQDVAKALQEKYQSSKTFMLPFLHFGALGQAQTDINHLIHDIGKPFFEISMPMNYWDHYEMMLEKDPPGFSYDVVSRYLSPNAVDQQLTELLVSMIEEEPAPGFIIDVFSMSRQISNVSPNATAFYHRNASGACTIIGKWKNKKQNKQYTEYIQKYRTLLSPYLTGGYPGIADRYCLNWNEEFYGDNYERLVEIKKKYDPNNIFRKDIQPLI